METPADPQTFARLLAACRRNMLAGLALSVLPAGLFYFLVFPYTPRQLAILGGFAAFDLVVLLPLDLLILRRSLQPIERALHAEASELDVRAGMARLLDSPWIVLVRIYGPHAIGATAVFNLLVVGANRYFGLGVSPSTYSLFWILNLTVVPFAHAVYEFAGMERAVQPYAKALAARIEPEESGARRFTLAQRMGVFFPMLAVAPLAIVLVTILIRRHATGAGIDAPILKEVSFVGIPVLALILYLMYVLGGELNSQTADVVSALDRLGEGDLNARVDLYSTSEFGQLAAHVNRMAASLEERQRLRDLFGAYMTPEVAHTLLAQGGPGTATEKRFVAAFFLDVRDFTAFSSQAPADSVVEVLNQIFAEAVEAIVAAGGTVNKYLGDGLLALFGAPVALENPCAAALRAALECSRRVKELNQRFAAGGKPAMRTGIGIHCGEVVVGSIGSVQHKLEYTAIGDALNIAARIEQLNKTLDTEILVSEAALRAAGAEWMSYAGPGNSQLVKGKSVPVTVHPIQPA